MTLKLKLKCSFGHLVWPKCRLVIHDDDVFIFILFFIFQFFRNRRILKKPEL